MFKMWLGKFISRVWGKKDSDGKEVSSMQRDGKKKFEENSFSAEHPIMEIEHRRLFIRKSIDEFTRRLWDEGQKLRGMERLLRKQSVGKGKDEEVQRRKETVDKRNIGFYRFSKTSEYRLIVEFFKQIEEDAYLNLRHPELAKDTKVTTGGVSGGIRYANHWISSDYHAGLQNGRIETIEDFRAMMMNAIMAIEKQKLEEENAILNSQGGK